MVTVLYLSIQIMVKFGFIRKHLYIMLQSIFGTVMALLRKETSQKEQPKESLFSKEEMEILLRIISEGTFKGKEIQVVYDLVYKLQQMYIEN